VLALDVGTSSVRALLFDRRGRVVPGAEAHLPYTAAEQVEAGKLDELVDAALDRVLRGRRRLELQGVGVSTFWHSLVGLGAEGRAVTPVHLWSDTRAWRQAEDLARRPDAESLRQRTGCPAHPSYWPAKLLWLRAEQPSLFRRVRAWASYADLLYERLFGRLQTSLSLASGTGLLRLADARWDEEQAGELGLDLGRLPPLGGFVSGLRAPYAARWPQLAEVPWFCALGDGALANLGSGCVDASQRALTVGTSAALRALTGRRPRRLPAGVWCYRLDRRRYAVGASFSNGGNLYSWLLLTLRLERPALERELRRREPSGLTFLPLLAGERSLGFAARARGAVAGLASTTSAGEIARAGLEAVAIRVAEADRRLDLVLPSARRLVASGAALLSSPGWRRLMADATGKPLVTSRAREASARGAALFVLEELGLASRTPAPGYGRALKPDPAAHAAYRQAAARLAGAAALALAVATIWFPWLAPGLHAAPAMMMH